jgi:triosephosphate isomerase
MVAVLPLPTAKSSVRPLSALSFPSGIEWSAGTQPDVDGFLVGGASLKPEFVNIVNAKTA